MRTVRIKNRERLVCPPEFQAEVTERFGVNRFDEPNFRIVWGQTEMTTVAGLHGYEERLLCSGAPCWNILRWIAPEVYGTPESWYAANYDELTKLCLLGLYPEKGRYEVAVPLMRKWMENGNLKFEAMPLNYSILDIVIPLLVQAEKIGWLERKLAQEEHERRENERIVQQIADRLQGELPSFYGPVSYAGQRTRVALIERKMDEIERKWKQLPHVIRNPRRGFFQH
jgi:hypothetical protein